MVVDDEPFNLDLLAQELETAGYELVLVDNGEDAVERAKAENPDVILLDVLMPGLDGFEVCRRLKASPRTQDVPVIFMTALSEVQNKLEAFMSGGVDYVTKPFQPEEVLARVNVHVELRRAKRELMDQNTRLQREIEAHRRARSTIEYLREEIAAVNPDEIVGESHGIKEALQKVDLVAGTSSTVLILGETGTGKELFARAIHDRSQRHEQPLVKVNCAALPHELIESELFGHEKGAFTGATQQRKGRFELADKGTLFLDEVSELSPTAQAKLLRVLQEKEFERVGGTESVRVDVRVIAATNRDLRGQVSVGRFREDLFYRLNVFPIRVPPLRERRSDIPLLARHFLDRFAQALGKPFEGCAPRFLAELEGYAWPGNVRELENVIERAAILSPGPLLDSEEALRMQAPPALSGGTLEDVERAYIVRVLEEKHWIIEGDDGAAAALGLNPSTLRGRLRKLGIEKPS